MFYESSINIVESPDSTSSIKELKGDLQPFRQTVSFEDGFYIDVTHRLFCNNEKEMTLDRYVQVNQDFFKIVFIERWSDYLDVWLYQCKT